MNAGNDTSATLPCTSDNGNFGASSGTSRPLVPLPAFDVMSSSAPPSMNDRSAPREGPLVGHSPLASSLEVGLSDLTTVETQAVFRLPDEPTAFHRLLTPHLPRLHRAALAFERKPRMRRICCRMAFCGRGSIGRTSTERTVGRSSAGSTGSCNGSTWTGAGGTDAGRRCGRGWQRPR